MELNLKKEKRKTKNHIQGKQFDRDKIFYIKLKEVSNVHNKNH